MRCGTAASPLTMLPDFPDRGFFTARFEIRAFEYLLTRALLSISVRALRPPLETQLHFVLIPPSSFA